MRYLRLLDPRWGIMSVRIVAGVILVTSGWQEMGKGADVNDRSLRQDGDPRPVSRRAVRRRA